MSYGCNSDDEEDDLSIKRQCTSLASTFALFTDRNISNTFTTECIFDSIGKVRVPTDLPVFELTDLKAALLNTRLRKVLQEMCQPYAIEYPNDTTSASLLADRSFARQISFPTGPSLTLSGNKRPKRGEGVPIVSRQELACNMCGLGKHILN